jgi:hypothetical protein
MCECHQSTKQCQPTNEKTKSKATRKFHDHQPLKQQTKQGSYPKSLIENVLTQ